MSAYIVDRETIDIITTALLDWASVPGEIREDAATTYGRKLWGWNRDAVAYRYPDDTDGERPGPEGWHDSDADTYLWTRHEAPPDEVRDAIGSLDYQCSEIPEWDASPARVLLLALRCAATHRVAAIEKAAAEARRTTPHIDYDVKQTAAQLRRELAQRFPGVRFSVRMERGTGYGWLDVAWLDGPAEADVTAVADTFRSERFDGRDDAYHAVEPTLYMIDGTPTEIRYSCRGVTVQRRLSPETKAAAEARARELLGVDVIDYGRWMECQRLTDGRLLRGTAWTLVLHLAGGHPDGCTCIA